MGRDGPVPQTGAGTAADRSAAIPARAGTVRSWPLLVLAAQAAAEVWSGWVGIAQKTGFGRVSLLPGIWPSLHLDTTITLPVGVEAYAAYALRAWLAREDWIGDRTRRFAKWSAICSFALAMAGQVAYHLLTQAGITRAPWPITTLVSCLPVLVLAMGTALPHMLRADAAADQPDAGTSGPAACRSPLVPRGPRRTTPGPDHRPRDTGRIRSSTWDQNGRAAGPQRRLREQGTESSGDRPGPPDRQEAHRSGEAGITASLAQRRNQRLQRSPERPGAQDQSRAGQHSIPARPWRHRDVIPRLRCSITAPGRSPVGGAAMDGAADRNQKENARPLLGKVARTRCNAAYHS